MFKKLSRVPIPLSKKSLSINKPCRSVYPQAPTAYSSVLFHLSINIISRFFLRLGCFYNNSSKQTSEPSSSCPPEHSIILTMSSNNTNNTSYGTMQTEKDKLPLYNTSSRTSTDTTASTDALLQKDSKKGSSDKDKGKVSTKAIFNSEFSCLSFRDMG